MKSLSNEIRAYALKNAIEFGKADAGRILPKLFQHGLDKKDIKSVMPEIQSIVKEVNKLGESERQNEFEKLKSLVKEREEKEGLPELPNAIEGKVVTRIAPEPSKYNHIGHALVFLIQYMYAQKYHGKCILRFDDSNPEKSKEEYYKAMKEDLSWIGIKWDEEKLASDNMPKIYELAGQLINEGNTFVCKCTQEEVKEYREKMKECKCRKRSKEENISEWKKMLEGKYKEGEVTLRLKGDMKSKNGVMRDPIIFRISYAEHFRQGKRYCVWPTYDFENPVEDSLNGVTHIIRSNEFELRAELHEYLLKKLRLKAPYVREIGRYQITGAETQGRVIREMIEKKEINGWDDPRLVTIKALRRRGFVPEMFQQLALIAGLSKSSGHIDTAVLASINRKIIDASANRYSFVEEPVKLEIKDAPQIKEIKVPLHPDKTEMITRKITKEIYIKKKDFEELKGKEARLIHLYNIKLDKKGNATFNGEENKEIPKINWVSAANKKVKVLMENGSWIEGLADENISALKEGDIVQFERFGFARLDKKGKDVLEFWFSHK